MKVAVATSGLGHVFRGMEGWAELLAEELSRSEIDVTLFRGASPPKNEYDVCIPCIKRTSRMAKYLSKLNLIGGWRIGLGHPAQVETWSYGLSLLRHLRKDFDLVHVKQGQLATFLTIAKKFRLLNIPFILGNGQVTSPKFIATQDYVQFLSPIEKAKIEKTLGKNEHWFYVPNFVNTDQFSQCSKDACRKKLNIPLDSFVVLTVATIQKYHKRMDYFIEEMNILQQNYDLPLHVIMAGAVSPDTKLLVETAKKSLGSKISVFVDLPKVQMPEIYNSADIFVLCSLREAFPNVLLEAMSCGITAIHHNDPILEWGAGDGGESCDLRQKGVLAKTVYKYANNPKLLEIKGEAGKRRVVREFSKEVVISKMIEMYKKIISKTN